MRRIVQALWRQVIKTAHDPARLVYVPFYYGRARLGAALESRPSLVTPITAIIPDGWIATPEGKAFCNGVGAALFQADYPVEAWCCIERSIRAGNVTTDEYLMGAMCLYHGLGRFKEAMALLERANALNAEEARRRGLANVPFRILDNVWGRHIGHTATLDYVVRLGTLEGRKPEDTMVYLPRGSKVANPFLLQQLSRQLRIVDDPADLPVDASAVQALHFDYLAPRLPDGTTAYFWDLAGQTYERWHALGKGPLLKLPDATVERGWAALRGAGVPQGGWFVALHVREAKWDERNTGAHGVLNANIDTYMPAIAEITSRGGWVIRMGDPGMKPLPALPNVIDYCHSPLRADWMDIFIATQCRFMLGTSSGPAVIPGVYGVPMLLTNWWPPAQRPWHASDIFVPKMMRRQDSKYLTLDQTLAEPFSYCHSRRYLAEQGVVVEDNEPDVITAATQEMLTRLNGQMDSNFEDLHARVDRIYRSHRVYGMGRLARGFLQKYDGFVG